MTREQLAAVLGNKTGSPLDVLDEREMEVLSMISQGKASRQVAEEMETTREALDEIKTAIRKKLGLKDEVALIQYAAKQRV